MKKKSDNKTWLSGTPVLVRVCVAIVILMILHILPFKEEAGFWVILAVLIGAVGVVCFGLGRIGRGQLAEQVALSDVKELAQEHKVDEEPIGNGDTADFLRGVLEEISFMQCSEDLFERYQYFTNLAEKVLNHTMGPCNISLWCPDYDYANLIECVIKPATHTESNSPIALNSRAQTRQPCQVPLDDNAIIESLKSGKPYLAELRAPGQGGSSSELVLKCDGCIPLGRQYGQPLLVNIELDQMAHGQESFDKNKREEKFATAVKLIGLFWKHLQATNQRQWMTEHDEPSGALRDETFLEQGQSRALKCVQRDEPFAVVVITLRGFRSMFAGNSQQWRSLAGLIGRSLKKKLTEKKKEFLLGKMADDVFALMLPCTDEFLAQNIMDTIVGQLEEQITEDEAVGSLDVMAVDIQWTVAGSNMYKDNLVGMLEGIYRRLFGGGQVGENSFYRIILKKQDNEVIEHAGSSKS